MESSQVELTGGRGGAADPDQVPDREQEGKPGAASRFLGPYRLLVGNRNLALLFAGQVVSTLGDWLYVIAVIVVAYDLTHSATLVALLTFVRLLPYALFLPLSGALADRVDRKTLMIVADAGRGICMFGLLVLQSRAALPAAFVLVFLATSMQSLFRPALNSTLPSVVVTDDLIEANSLMSQMDSLAFVLGPALGGVFVLLGQPRLAFVVTGATALVSAATLVLLHLPEAKDAAHPEEGGLLGELLAGFRFLFPANRGVLAAFTVAMAGVGLMDGAFWTLSIVLPTQVFHLGDQGAGFLNATYGAGGLVGAVVVGPLLRRLPMEWAFVLAAAGSSILAALLGLSPAGVLPFAWLALMAVADVAMQVSGTTVIQSATPHELLGRAFAAFEATLIVSMLVGSLLVGPLIAAFGPRGSTVAFAVIGIAVLLVCAPRLRIMREALGVRVFLWKVPILATLSVHVLDDVASRLHLETYPAGADIVQEGDVGDHLYLIKTGEVEVLARDNREHATPVGTISHPGYFGEIALLRDVPRTATIRALVPVEVYTLSRSDFQSLLRRSQEFESAVTSTSDARALATQTRLLTRR